MLKTESCETKSQYCRIVGEVTFAAVTRHCIMGIHSKSTGGVHNLTPAGIIVMRKGRKLCFTSWVQSFNVEEEVNRWVLCRYF